MSGLLMMLLAILAASTPVPVDRPVVVVGSKGFTESVILGELARGLAEDAGAEVVHRAELGGTRVLWSALRSGEIDLYPDYTGTLALEILADENVVTPAEIRAALARRGVRMTAPLGFNNTYAIGMRHDRAAEVAVGRISDLRNQPQLEMGFTNEFMDRRDGWPGLRDRYRLPQRNVRGLDHDLAYQALASGAIDVTDLYATDAKILKYELTILEDDLGHFPRYDAVFLYRADLKDRAPQVVAALRRLEGAIDQAAMVKLNAEVEQEGLSEAEVAAGVLLDRFDITHEVTTESMPWFILRLTGEHLYLVGVSLLAAIAVAVPLGVWAAKRPRSGQAVLGVVGIIQTIPALALLVLLMKPLTWLGVGGIGAPPAIVALFLYSLLPIVRNTYTGMHDAPLHIRESAEALGLTPWARLRLIELPMASRMILAGIKTAAVINVGFATLGALIGAGGYGQPILTGIRLNSYSLILQGALPAAGLAIVVQGGFEIIDRLLVPKGLRLKPQS